MYFSDQKIDDKYLHGNEEHETALAEQGLEVRAMHRIVPQAPTWIVQDMIPDCGVTIVAGEPGVGKTFFGCHLLADLTREIQHRVVLATSGYESPELLRWRLDQAGADNQRIAFVTLQPRGYTDRRNKPSEELLDERLTILERMVDAAGTAKGGILPDDVFTAEEKSAVKPIPARVVVIDDVDGWLGKPGKMLSAAALTRTIQRLDSLARVKKLAVVVLARLQLSIEGRATAHQLSRLSHAASVVWLLARDRDGGTERQRDGASAGAEGWNNPKAKIENPKSVRYLLPLKNNLATDVATYGRTFELADGRMRWLPKELTPPLAEVMSPSLSRSAQRSEREAAAEWALEALADGPLPSDEFYRQAIECGFAKITMRRALAGLGVKSHKTGFKGGWELRLRGQGTGDGTQRVPEGTESPKSEVQSPKLSEDAHGDGSRKFEVQSPKSLEGAHAVYGEAMPEIPANGEDAHAQVTGDSTQTVPEVAGNGKGHFTGNGRPSSRRLRRREARRQKLARRLAEENSRNLSQPVAKTG